MLSQGGRQGQQAGLAPCPGGTAGRPAGHLVPVKEAGRQAGWLCNPFKEASRHGGRQMGLVSASRR